MRKVCPLAATASLLLSMLLAACGSDDGAPGGGTGVQRGGSVTIIELADISKPMPLISESSLDNAISSTLYLSLLAPKWEDGQLHYLTSDEDVTALARSYEFFGPDSASLRYNLRTDVRWSDGVPVTAHDAAWTLEMQGDPRTASPRQGYNQLIREIVAEDDSTLVVHFERRYPEVFFHTAGNVAPRHVFQDTDPSQLRNHPTVNTPGGGALVVSGPYMVGEWLRGQRLVLVPNPEFQPQPNIERIVFRVIPEETTRLIEFQTGNADMMEIPFDKLDLVRQSTPGVRFESQRRRFYDYIGYNPAGHPAFADPEIRRALGLAIDKEGLIAALSLGEYAEPAGGPFAPIFRLLYDPSGQAPLPFDTAQAVRILESKGWVRGPDGVRAQGGQALRFNLTTNAGNQRRADVAQIVQQQWSRIGVDARIQTIETNTFFDRLNGRDFEAAIAGWGVGLSADLTTLWEGDGPFNFTDYNDPQTSALFRQALEQPTEETAAPYWRDAASRIVAAQPYTWLYYLDAVHGVRDRVRGARIDTLSEYQNLHEWWLADGAGAGSEP